MDRWMGGWGLMDGWMGGGGKKGETTKVQVHVPTRVAIS